VALVWGGCPLNRVRCRTGGVPLETVDLDGGTVFLDSTSSGTLGFEALMSKQILNDTTDSFLTIPRNDSQPHNPFINPFQHVPSLPSPWARSSC
jgi:hypothetical protein